MTKKNSRQMFAILNTLRENAIHPTAEWIYDNVRTNIPNISLGTVYRNLSNLCVNGEIIKIKVDDGPDRFDGNSEPHYHFYCNTCKRLLDVHIPLFKALNTAAENETGFTVDSHHVQFFGICDTCKTKKNSGGH